jgi:SNF2 family DNA or RNA helicase
MVPTPSNTGVYRPRFPPFKHQAEALEKMLGRENFALLMEMRTGKTKTCLDDFGRLELEGKVSGLLVLAPGGVYRTWTDAIGEHLSADLAQRCAVHVWTSGSGSGEKKRRLAFSLATDRPRILLMNIEALSSVKDAREFAKAFLDAAPAIVAVDESTCIKNPTSKRTKFVLQEVAPRARFRRILSGGPAPKSPLDLYSQFGFLHWNILGFKSFFAFRGRYAILQPTFFGGRTVQLVKGFRDLDDLQRRIEPHSYRARLRDCYDLPEKAYMFRDVELTSEQQRLYSEMKSYATASIGDGSHVTATIVIAQITRLHQILCGHVVDESGKFHEIPENRTAALLELLEEYSGKAIIWCSYDADVRKVAAALAEEYGPSSVAMFWGGNQSAREDEERRFKTEDACRFIVATAQAGGRGRTWSVADLVIYYSNTTDLEHRMQSEERPQGIGKTTSVAYVDLRVRDTVDEKLIDAHRAKITIADALMGDGYREWLI